MAMAMKELANTFSPVRHRSPGNHEDRGTDVGAAIAGRSSLNVKRERGPGVRQNLTDIEPYQNRQVRARGKVG